LHQPASVIKLSGPSIHSSILVPLLVMAAAFTCFFLLLHLKAMRAEVLRRRREALIASHAAA
jgi:heme exporter protein C